MSHIVNECPLTKFPGGIQALHTADEDAINWLHKFSIHAGSLSSSGSEFQTIGPAIENARRPYVLSRLLHFSALEVLLEHILLHCDLINFGLLTPSVHLYPTTY